MKATDPTPFQTQAPHAGQDAILSAIEQLFEPLARLCVERGVPIQALEEKLRLSHVRAARQACERDDPRQKDRLTSRISAMTGLTRREVARLDAEQPPRRNKSRTLVSDLFAQWLAAPECRDAQGGLPEIARSGEPPSFEALAARVSRDVHHRSLLDEMVRLGLVVHDAASDRVRLSQDAFVPREDRSRMLAWLADNVGDHLDAAVTNLLGRGDSHFEQALFADELSAESVARARPLIAAQWQQLMTTLAPALQALMDEDQASGRVQDQCLRIGLYSLSRAMTGNARLDSTPADPEFPPEA